MNREIKFRAWEEKYNCWDKGGFYFYVNDPFQKQGFVIQQYTGLKDKNDKDICEGDIVKCHRLRFPDNHRKDIDFSKLPWPEDHWYDCIEIGKIRWSDVSFGFVEDYEHIRYDDIWPLSCGTSHRYEVIGNIFENSNLLDNTSKV
jgi:hypothetical protein